MKLLVLVLLISAFHALDAESEEVDQPLVVSDDSNEQMSCQLSTKPCGCKKATTEDELKDLFSRNEAIVKKNTQIDPEYYSKHASGQKPKFLWIGCSDSRVIPEDMIGAEIGQIFVHRNVANQIDMSDKSAMAVLQYSVEYLGVENIIVAGHYGCGGIKTSFTNTNYGNLQSWLHQIRQIRLKYAKEMTGDQTKDEPKLVQLNVKEQVHRIAQTSFVQNIWKSGKTLKIFGVVYDIVSGKLIATGDAIRGFEDLCKYERFYE